MMVYGDMEKWKNGRMECFTCGKATDDKGGDWRFEVLEGD
jgi:hypothetical protein